MKKNALGAAMLAAVLVSGALGACSGNPGETAATDTTAVAAGTQAADSKEGETVAVEARTTQASAELREIVVEASPASHAEILNAAKEVLVSKGYELKIVEYTGYVQPNNALDSGDLDTNYFQHKPCLNSFNAQDGAKLVSTDAIHYEPFGIYADKTASLEELPDKVAVLVPNDVSNGAKALLLLEAQGLVKLKDGVGLEAIENDIVKSTKNLDTVELEVAQLSRSIPGGDITVINGNYAIEAGLRVNDALATENPRLLAATIYGNMVAVREGEESSDTTEALMEALISPEMKQFMEGAYGGAVVPLF